jgi:hypothetical protein
MNTDEQSELSEFRDQLASDDFAVVRVALDDYQAAQADTRWGHAVGSGQPVRAAADEVRRAARRLLGPSRSDR